MQFDGKKVTDWRIHDKEIQMHRGAADLHVVAAISWVVQPPATRTFNLIAAARNSFSPFPYDRTDRREKGSSWLWFVIDHR